MLAWCYEHIDPEKREEWEFMLEAPLPGDEGRTRQTDLDKDAELFMAAMRQNKG